MRFKNQANLKFGPKPKLNLKENVWFWISDRNRGVLLGGANVSWPRRHRTGSNTSRYLMPGKLDLLALDFLTLNQTRN